MNFFKTILRKLRTFTKIPWYQKLLFAEAVVTSCIVKFTLLFLPFGIVVKWLGTTNAEELRSLSKEQIVLVNNLRFAIKLCDRYVPWPTECYTRSLTAKLILKRRNQSSTIYFGFCRDNSGKLTGHAWLKSSGLVVTGFCDFSKFQVHSVFS